MIRLSAISLITLLFLTTGISAQTSHIKGVVQDDKKNPVAYANIYIEGTIDGTSSEEDGSFILETTAKGTVTLKASFVGYKTYSITEDISKLNNLTIVLKEDLTNLKEVVISAGNYQLKGTNMEKTNAVELVTTAGSEGDLYKSIALLPGMQIGGTDGKLQVRGGSSHESQTYIDEMHVMKAYTSMPANTGSRSVFSPFIFETINFSTGGYSSEYSQSLSSVLPLYTKDESPVTKTGVSLTSVGAGSGGTKAWNKGSVSFEMNYTNLAPYSKLLFPSEKPEWDKYYQGLQASNQIRLELGDKTYLKTFFSYNKTAFKKKETGLFDNIQRGTDFDEDNLYLNSTFNKKFKSGVNYFAGAAFSWNRQDIKNAKVLNDAFKSNETELHLKTKASKRYSSLYKLGAGMESLIKGYEITYKSDGDIDRKVNHSINGLFVTNDFNLTYNLLLNVSSRLEYTTLDKSWAVLPRIALNYNIKDITLSGAIGKYQQTTDNDYLIYNEHLAQENTTQYVLSAQNAITQFRVFRIEAYYKKYNKLTTLHNGVYQSGGDGYSKGVDLLYKDGIITGKGQMFEYMLGYSFNDSKRKYLDYPEKVTPPYLTKHNASIVLKYSNQKLKSIFGLTNRFAGGRPYNDPNKEGTMNSKTPVYNTLDFSWTILAHKKLIIYASASNILGRDNIYGYNYNPVPTAQGKYESKPVKMYQKQFFFIGFFISLSGKAAYDVSSF
ncbi:MAG: TonB-dependent receptor [Prevotella sp.]|jgi:hypothetical protein|nr:TonB-dependent receptor [Prevotella sp.]